MQKFELEVLKTAFMQTWNSIVITDADPSAGYIVQMANPAFCSMTGYSLAELRGQNLRMLQGPETDQSVIDVLRQCLKEARYFEGTTVNYRKDGRSYIVRWSISPVRDEGGLLTHFVSVQQDLTEHYVNESKRLLLAKTLDATADPVLLTDVDSHIVFANIAFSAQTGYAVEEVLGKTPALLKSGEHDEEFYAEMRESLRRGRGFRGTFINRRRDGSLFHAEQTISPIMDENGNVTHFVSFGKDVSDRVRHDEELLVAATTDLLTGLYNRRHGEKLLSMAISNSSKCGVPLCVVLCDIDHFKPINDQFGHGAGDRVLAAVGRQMKNTVRSTDSVIRWGGEEFLIVLPDCDEDSALERAERIRQEIHSNRDEEVGGVTVSLGVAIQLPGETSDYVVARADKALYQAKERGRNRVVLAQKSFG